MASYVFCPAAAGITAGDVYCVFVNPQTGQVYSAGQVNNWQTASSAPDADSLFTAAEVMTANSSLQHYRVQVPAPIENQAVHAWFFKSAVSGTKAPAVDTRLGNHAYEPSLHYNFSGSLPAGSGAAYLKALNGNEFLAGVATLSVDEFKTEVFTTPITGFTDPAGNANASVESAMSNVTSGSTTISPADITAMTKGVLGLDVSEIAETLTPENIGRHSLASLVLMQTNADSKTVANAIVIRDPTTEGILHTYTIQVGCGQPITSIS